MLAVSLRQRRNGKSEGIPINQTAESLVDQRQGQMKFTNPGDKTTAAKEV